MECYFLEQWIQDLIDKGKKRTTIENTLLNKLGRISKFLHENILSIVMSDMLILLDFYFSQKTQLMIKAQHFEN